MTKQQIAEYVLDQLKKQGADKASLSVSQFRKEEFNIEANKFTLLRTLFSDSLIIKALCAHQKGVASINKLDRDSIDRAIADAIALAKSAAPDEAEDIAPLVENKDFKRNIGGGNLDELFERTRESLEQIRSEYPKIIIDGMTTTFDSGQCVYANSNGVVFTDEVELYGISNTFCAKDGEKTSTLNGFGAARLDLDVPFLDIGQHRQRLEESIKSLDTRVLRGKFLGPVVVTPQGSGMVWGTIFDCFLGDRALVEGSSRWKDSLGTKVADSKLTMRTVPHHPSIIQGERFTGDGFESFDMDIIRNGTLESFVLSLYGANKTGNQRAKNSGGNLEVASGDVALADMIKGIDRGILLNSFSGASPGPSGDVSGVAKNSFLIEKGEVAEAIVETMVSFNIVDILRDIPAISKERIEDGSSILPWCCFDGITISGAS